ncbi:dihydrofolate reductase family protein [Microlunatus lacustris]
MSRELVWTGFMTVDGKVDSPGGTVEGHPGGGWVLDTEFLPEAFSLKEEELADTSALMFGGRSYDAFAPVWSTSADHAAYQELPKYVVSSTMAASELADNWGPTALLRSSEEVAELKRQDGGAIYIHGSAELARRLAEAHLIDRYNLLVHPYVLGSGKSIFTSGDRDRQKLRLLDSDTYANGVVKLIYRVTPPR